MEIVLMTKPYTIKWMILLFIQIRSSSYLKSKTESIMDMILWSTLFLNGRYNSEGLRFVSVIKGGGIKNFFIRKKT